MKKIVGIASMPSRELGLIDTIESLSPQVDEIYVWLNGYKEIPKTSVTNVTFHLSETNDGAIAKVRCLGLFDDTEFYYFTCDDDIVYPSDYVEKYIEIYEPGSIQSSHANKYASFPISDYTKADISGYYFGAHIPKKDRVHLVGTGVCMMDSTIARQLPYETFTTTNMLDLWVSSWAWISEIPMYVVPHKRDWLYPNPKIQQNDSIWNGVLRNSDHQTQIINHYYT